MKRLLVPLFSLAALGGHALAGVLIGVALLPACFLVLGAWRASQTALDNPLLGALLVCLALGVGYFVFGYTFLVLIVLARLLLRLRNREMVGEIISYAAFGNAAYNFLIALAAHFFLPIMRGTPMLVWFYRGMGARIGEYTLIMTTRIFDCDLIEIGDYCVIGGNVAINGHLGEGRRGLLRRVRIGNRVSLGANSMILPGAVIEDNVILGANSLVPKDRVLKAGLVYGGVPARAIGRRNGPKEAGREVDLEETAYESLPGEDI
jgi:acetyltransferase-like isoleucine patch superfamily enzyme